MRYPDIVARCEQCGRPYVYMNPDRETVPCLVNGCAGMIRRLPAPEPNPVSCAEDRKERRSAEAARRRQGERR